MGARATMRRAACGTIGGWMAKLRVHELARELNMDNKGLLEKLRELDIEVKSHASTLEEDDVARVKSALFGGKPSGEIVEEKRVKPNLIRRRKKIVQEPVEPELPISEPVAAGEPDTPEAAPEADTKTETMEAIQPAAAAEAAPEETAKTETAPAPEPEETEPAEAETTPAPADVAAPPEAVAEPLETEAEPESPAPTAEETPVSKTKAKRKVKKSTPAKIISMPEPSEAPPKPEPEPEPEKAPTPVADAVPEETAKTKHDKKRLQFEDLKGLMGAEAAKEDEGDKKLKKKKPLDDIKGRKADKIKTALRRKEVIEGDALYDRGAGRGRKSRKKGKQQHFPSDQKTQITTPKAIKRRIKIDDNIVLGDLAKRMGVKAGEIISKLMGMGVMVTVNQTIDYDTASLVAQEFNFEAEKASFKEEAYFKMENDDPSQLTSRPPVVTIMGHVDHGKTSLLDVIRQTKVTELESGGITQHIGAYHVQLDRGDIVFLDTPGHEAFTAMRSRGAHVTDIVVLVVAADDGVMPQTIEAINHAKAAEVPIIVAVNKIDKEGADLERIRRQLAEKGLSPEEWGGDTIFVDVSAKQKIGIDTLLEMILLQTEILELTANPNKPAKGHIVESKLDIGRGAVATVLVQEGTLHVGDPVVCGMYYGKIRMMFNDMGAAVKSAGPSIPVEIVGLSGVPMAGDELVALAAEKDAKQVSEHRLQQQRARALASTSRLSLEKLYEQMAEGEVKDLNIIIKADVQGSIEALAEALKKLSTDEVKVNIVHSGVGSILESDVSLAAVTNAIILGFHVRPAPKVSGMAEEEHVDIRYYDVIYNTIKDVQDAMLGLMSSKFEERPLGQAEVRQVFTVPGLGTIAGSMVTSGKIQRGQQARLVRDGIVVFTGKIDSLRRFKDDAKEVAQNYECGIHIENFNDIKLGDVIECFYLEEIKPVLA
jgi:translation initiation factor IF-2